MEGKSNMTTFTIKILPETDEYAIIVRENGKINEGRCYYTPDRDDAVATLQAMEKEEAAKIAIVRPRAFWQEVVRDLTSELHTFENFWDWKSNPCLNRRRAKKLARIASINGSF